MINPILIKHMDAEIFFYANEQYYYSDCGHEYHLYTCSNLPNTYLGRRFTVDGEKWIAMVYDVGRYIGDESSEPQKAFQSHMGQILGEIERLKGFTALHYKL